jgi:hypothetical protein
LQDSFFFINHSAPKNTQNHFEVIFSEKVY